MTFCHFAYTSRRCRRIKGEKDKEKCGLIFYLLLIGYEDASLRETTKEKCQLVQEKTPKL